MAKTATASTATKKNDPKNNAPAPSDPTPGDDNGNGAAPAAASEEPQAAPVSMITDALPTVLLGLDQIEQHPDNALWRLYSQGRQKELNEMVEARPQDSTLHPLRVVPARDADGKQILTASGKVLYWTIGGNHQLESYRLGNWAAAPAIINNDLDPGEQVIFMAADNRTKTLTPLEIGLNCLLYKERVKNGDEKATQGRYARSVGLTDSSISLAVTAAKTFKEFPEKLQKRIVDAESRFTERHFRELKKAPKAERVALAEWALDNEVSHTELARVIQLRAGHIDSTQYVRQGLGKLVTEGLKAADPVTFPDQNKGAGGAVDLARGTSSGARQQTAARPGAQAAAAAQQVAQAAPAQRSPEQWIEDTKGYLEGGLSEDFEQVMEVVRNFVAGDTQKTVQSLLLGWLNARVDQVKAVPLRLGLDAPAGTGAEVGDAGDSEASDGLGEGLAADGGVSGEIDLSELSDLSEGLGEEAGEEAGIDLEEEEETATE